jgi:hypothetical protein
MAAKVLYAIGWAPFLLALRFVAPGYLKKTLEGSMLTGFMLAHSTTHHIVAYWTMPKEL